MLARIEAPVLNPSVILVRTRSLLVLALLLGIGRPLAGQERRISSQAPSVQILRLTPTSTARMRVAPTGPVTDLGAEQKIEIAREALAPTGRAVHGVEPPIRINAVTPRVAHRAWMMLNEATLIAGDGITDVEGEIRLGGQSSYLRLYLTLVQPSQPQLLQCLVQGKPGVTTVVVRAGAATMQTSLEPGWHHVGWLLYPEGVGNYVVELAPGPHYLLAVQYCELTPIN